MCADGNGHVKVVANSNAEEVCRRNADDLHGFVVESELFAQRRAAGEFSLPEAMANDCAGQSTAGPVIRRREESSGSRLDAEDAEEIAAYVEAGHKMGVAARVTRKVRLSPPSDSGKSRMILAQILPDRIRNYRIAACKISARLVHIDDTDLRQLLWIPDRQRLQQDGVDQLKESGVGANTKRKRGDHDE